MAQPREFEPSAVLEKATDVFRSRGFKGASFSRLTRTLRISRQSLYDTFGNKETLFLTALGRSFGQTLYQVEHALADPRPVREALGRAFHVLLAEESASGGHARFLAGILVEFPPNRARAVSAATEHARAFELLFETRLQDSQAEGEIDQQINVGALARVLFCAVIGLAASTVITRNRTSQREATDLLLRIIPAGNRT